MNAERMELVLALEGKAGARVVFRSTDDRDLYLVVKMFGTPEESHKEATPHTIKFWASADMNKTVSFWSTKTPMHGSAREAAVAEARRIIDAETPRIRRMLAGGAVSGELKGIGFYGGPGSGKSTLNTQFKLRGVGVVESDAVRRELFPRLFARKEFWRAWRTDHPEHEAWKRADDFVAREIARRASEGDIVLSHDDDGRYKVEFWYPIHRGLKVALERIGREGDDASRKEAAIHWHVKEAGR